MKCLHPNCEKELTKAQKKFCSRSCANSYNNRVNPKRKLEGQCKSCGKPIHSYENWCSEDCKPLPQGRNKELVVKAVVGWRQRTKLLLVEHFGDKCHDCEESFPPFMYDFDHRDPSEKSFGIGGKTKSWDSLLEEAKKCDMVCANCHRMRTHKQRCKDEGCLYC